MVEGVGEFGALHRFPDGIDVVEDECTNFPSHTGSGELLSVREWLQDEHVEQLCTWR